MEDMAVCGFIIGVVNCWNYFVLKENRTIGGALLNPIPAYISGIFSKFGIPAFLIYLFVTAKLSVALVALGTIAVGYFIGGFVWGALYVFARIIGIISIIPSIICIYLAIK